MEPRRGNLEFIAVLGADLDVDEDAMEDPAFREPTVRSDSPDQQQRPSR
jgi:hypothetical protein